MTEAEFWKTVLASTKEEWGYVGISEDLSIAFYKPDMNIRFENDENALLIKDFRETWTGNQIDPVASKHDIRAFYGNTCIASIPMVAVDGHRAWVPIPEKKGNNTVSYRDYRVAELAFENNSALDEYIKLCKLTVERN